ncbi:MAG: ABC transporter permease [Deltaproteobacteria bacterium]|nr:ABC transporter permease [Deltaproteobacteria bacterium]
MSDPTGPPSEKRTDSIPLLLARTSRRGKAATAEVEKQRRSMAPASPSLKIPSQRLDTSGRIGLLRSRLGAFGTIAALVLVLAAIFADLLASDLPIACKVHGKTWLFASVVRPAELVEMGPARVAAEAEWQLRPIVRHGPRATAAAEPKAEGPTRPGAGHPFGTDREGRDVFARVVHGTRSYLVFALGAVLASLFLGGLFGAIAGLFGGATDALVGRAIETVSAFPPLVLVLGIQAAVPKATLATLFLAIALTRWPEVARLVRAEVLHVATRDYVMAARALGASPLRVLRKHIAPNVRGQLVVLGAIGVPAVVLIEASLDFLRVGAPAGAASWGQTMSEFRDAPHAWWLLLFPGAFLFVTVVAMNLVGEARREALDPRGR